MGNKWNNTRLREGEGSQENAVSKIMSLYAFNIDRGLYVYWGQQFRSHHHHCLSIYRYSVLCSDAELVYPQIMWVFWLTPCPADLQYTMIYLSIYLSIYNDKGHLGRGMRKKMKKRNHSTLFQECKKLILPFGELFLF